MILVRFLTFLLTLTTFLAIEVLFERFFSQEQMLKTFFPILTDICEELVLEEKYTSEFCETRREVLFCNFLRIGLRSGLEDIVSDIKEFVVRVLDRVELMKMPFRRVSGC